MELKDYLESRYLSRKEFAKLVGVNTATITNYIQGHRIPILAIALKIQEVTNGKVSVQDLVKIRRKKDDGNR
jgi:transcriptional regulator with XRE-family HTH domain